MIDKINGNMPLAFLHDLLVFYELRMTASAFRMPNGQTRVRVTLGDPDGFAASKLGSTVADALHGAMCDYLIERSPKEVAPIAKCMSCHHEEPCIKLGDGTIVKPLAWRYPHDDRPLEGLCGRCQ